MFLFEFVVVVFWSGFVVFVLLLVYVVWGFIYFGIWLVLEGGVLLLMMVFGVCFIIVGLLMYVVLCWCGMLVLIWW